MEMLNNYDYGQIFSIEREIQSDKVQEQYKYKSIRKMGNRRFPVKLKTEDINDDGEFYMNCIDLLKKGTMNYVVYGYLQLNSNFDKESKVYYRKIYIEYLNATQIAKECKKTSSRNTVSKALKILEVLNLLSKKTFEDDFGKYKKLYNLDGEYVLLDFDKRPIQKLVTCLKSEGVALFLILKKYCNIYGKCTLTQSQLLEILGYNKTSGTSMKCLRLFLETLEDIGCIRIEKVFKDNKVQKNILRERKIIMCEKIRNNKDFRSDNMNGDIGSVFKKEHKDLVEKNKDYKYIATCKKNNRLFIKVKHLYCNKIYTIRLDGWCQGSKPCGNYSRVGCCGSYENSFAYYIEVKLGLNLDDLWNWKKNNENNVNPYYISYGSTKKIWVYCLEHDYHNYDRYDNKIGYQTTCNNFSQGKRCGYCNGTSKSHWKDSLGYLYDDIAKMVAIPENNLTFEDTFEITPKSGRKFYIKCLRCGKVCSDKKDLHHIQNYGFSCNYCSDGISIPEKFMSNILKQLDINFQTQLNKSIFKWCGEYKYDFYIPVFNMIIETHGRQHYDDCEYNDYDVEKQKKIDEDKRTIALKNNIQNYIVVNCKYSTLTWLKENIEKELSSSFNLSNMDWKLAWRECQNSLCMRALELHKKGYKNKKIAEELNINRTTVTEWLKRLNIKTKPEKKQENKKETLKLLNRGISINEISMILNCSERTIRNYVNELLKENKFIQSEKIRCIELNIIFDSISEASEYVGCYPLEILKCLKGKQIISGGYHWEYVHEDIN